ncbi:hypothetical protein, partial [Pantoea piersonii]|uniref:hypothetical protein n=1 Tax=Pantoea piersonii TaxID=2364647 RepID=UPI00289B23E7
LISESYTGFLTLFTLQVAALLFSFPSITCEKTARGYTSISSDCSLKITTFYFLFSACGITLLLRPGLASRDQLYFQTRNSQQQR